MTRPARRDKHRALAICARLARRDPANTGWQRDLAVAHTRVGDVARDRGDLVRAEYALAKALPILERLAALDPANTGWVQDLAVAQRRVNAVRNKLFGPR